MLKIGHRGASGYFPENTLKSFKKAIEIGVDAIELDVHLCKTGEVILMHDEKLNRTTNGRGLVRRKNLTELKKLNAGSGEKIPLLTEVLNLVKKRVKVNIELKGRGTAKPVYEIIEDYVKNKGWSYKDFFVSSFNPLELIDFYSLNKKIKLGVLFENHSGFFLEISDQINAYSINPALEIVTEDLVKRAHDKGLKVFVWTVNEPEDIKRMKKIKVDGIFSNFPDRI